MVVVEGIGIHHLGCDEETDNKEIMFSIQCLLLLYSFVLEYKVSNLMFKICLKLYGILDYSTPSMCSFLLNPIHVYMPLNTILPKIK